MNKYIDAYAVKTTSAYSIETASSEGFFSQLQLAKRQTCFGYFLQKAAATSAAA